MRNIKRTVDGIFLLDKRIQESSNQALQEIKRIFRAKKAGHSGTLDVLASGLLPICLGEATKVSQYLLKEKKSYLCEFTFGVTTRSGDLEGEILCRKDTDFLTEELVTKAVTKFVGCIEQVPPMHSALKRNGVPLYKLARRGIEVDRESRRIEVYRFEMSSFAQISAKFDIECSKGTYIRQLAEDLGRELGCGACVSFLRRENLGAYSLKKAHTIENLRSMLNLGGLPQIDGLLLGADSALTRFPPISVSTADSIKLEMGQRVAVVGDSQIGLVRLYDEKGKFFGVGERLPNALLASRRLIKSRLDLE